MVIDSITTVAIDDDETDVGLTFRTILSKRIGAQKLEIFLFCKCDWSLIALTKGSIFRECWRQQFQVLDWP